MSSSSTAASVTKKLFIGANWKCNLQTVDQVDALVQQLNQMWRSLPKQQTDVVELCVHPPYVYLDRVRQALASTLGVGSQNVYDANGPFGGHTGTTTPQMIQSLGCNYVLLGHSDRRNQLGETDDLIATKVDAVLQAGLGLCLTMGERTWQRQFGLTDFILHLQFQKATQSVPSEAWSRIVIAYEPVWSIGEGATPCSPAEAQRILAKVRQWIRQKAGPEASQACRLTYTGSVNEKNAADYAGLSDVDGFVVGRAGLDAKKLQTIIQVLADSHPNNNNKDTPTTAAKL